MAWGTLRPRLVCLTLACVLLAGAAGPASAAKRRVPFGFFGTVLDPGNSPPNVSFQTLDSQMALMARSGVEAVRVTFDWPNVEPAHNVYQFVYTDQIVRAAAQHGIQLLANIGFTPTWASSRPNAFGPFRYEPKSDQLFADFATKLVQRYGPHGLFWKLNPGLLANPVREWQIWNEQSFDVFWSTTPWPSTYTRLLRAGYVAIHRADRGATVVPGSLVAHGSSTPWGQLEQLYRAGARRYFDEISVHPFTDGSITVSQSIGHMSTIIQTVRNVMRRHGDGRKPIILTEMTWPGARGKIPASRLLGIESTPHGELLRLTAAYSYLAAHMRQIGVRQAYWYAWASTFDPTSSNFAVGYEFAGLTRLSHGLFIPQPALTTYAREAAHFEGCSKGATAKSCR